MIWVKVRIILICVLFVIASLLGMFAQDLAFMIYNPTGFGNPVVLEWSTYLSWLFYFVMLVIIFTSDVKDKRVKFLFAVFISSGILVSVWSLFVIAMSL